MACCEVTTHMPELSAVVKSLLHSIPERWTDFAHDALSHTEQNAMFLLIAAGLVERRIGVRGEFAGLAPAVEFTIDATGEYGLVEAMEPVAVEMWTKWGPAFEAWKASDAGGSTPFRFTRTGLDRWRLTEQGIIARGDLDIEAPNPGAAAVVGSYQRAIEFITRTGHQADRPSVRGEGRLVEMIVVDSPPGSTNPPTPISLANSPELAAAFRDIVVPALAEALDQSSEPPVVPVSETSAQNTASEGIGGDDTPANIPPLTENEVAVIKTLARFDPSRLVSGVMIETEMDGPINLSRRTIQPIVVCLIELGLAERPRGDRSGVRLTIAGRRLASKISD